MQRVPVNEHHNPSSPLLPPLRSGTVPFPAAAPPAPPELPARAARAPSAAMSSRGKPGAAVPKNKRVMKEIEACESDKEAKVKIEVVEDNLSHLKGAFEGPPGTVYEGGKYVVDIQIPQDYPFKPPKMKFDTKIYHPNISSQTGAICLDILKADGGSWSPVYTLKTAILSLQALLQSPEPKDPQDAEVAKVFMSNPAEFDRTARAWTRMYAGGTGGTEAAPAGAGPAQPQKKEPLPPGIKEEAVGRLCDMGFARADVIRALVKAGGKEDVAVEALLTGM
ncbi:ubiquitin-conjugating enzyme/RWD-like protein [Hyaloraphidium curvatum]|nr:ubiquitin-conjugating enzyme/RWD-like protein [Hyaloraphidium curvatum]